MIILILSLYFVTILAEEGAAHIAARSDDIGSLKRALVSQGFDKNEKGFGGQTPLMAACLVGSTKAVKWLLGFEADITIPEKDGYTCFHGIGFQGRGEIVPLLYSRGFEDDMHSDGYYGFHRACWGTEERHAKTVLAFLEQGVDPDLKTKDGRTCVDIAKSQLVKDVVKEFKSKKNEL